jgi:hypothetical protein
MDGRDWNLCPNGWMKNRRGRKEGKIFLVEEGISVFPLVLLAQVMR